MNILILYFSGTGNTEKIANEYRAAFENIGSSVTAIPLPLESRTLDSLEIPTYDLIGIGYPIHSFNAPRIILDTCKQFPKLDANGRKRVFVFKTSGEPVRMSDVSSLKMRGLLKKRGYDVRNEYQYVMPYNIIFRHSDQAAYKMWQTAKSLVPIDVNEIASDKSVLPKRMFMGRFLAWVLRIEHGGAHINGRFYKVNKNCVHCGLCIKTCPMKNISIKKNGKIKFGGKCMMCMRCSMNCPKNAIEIGMFKKWKVNGAYSFAEPTADAPQDNKHAAYCAKAYKRYYENAEKKRSQIDY